MRKLLRKTQSLEGEKVAASNSGKTQTAYELVGYTPLFEDKIKMEGGAYKKISFNPFESCNLFSLGERISESFTISDAELATHVGVTGALQVTGTPGSQIGMSLAWPTTRFLFNVGMQDLDSAPPEAAYLLRYGYRRKSISDPLFNPSNAEDADRLKEEHARIMYIYANKNIATGTVDIIMRPEIDIALPTYFPERNEYYYIDSISHNYSVGGTCTTQVGLVFGRTAYHTYHDMLDYILYAKANQSPPVILYSGKEPTVTSEPSPAVPSQENVTSLGGFTVTGGELFIPSPP